MQANKLSILLPQQQYDFIENYRAEYYYKSRSGVIREVLYLLQKMQLESCYLEANDEIDAAFDSYTISHPVELQ